MLDEPPLIVRMHALAGCVTDSRFFRQSDRSQLHVADAQALRNLHKHSSVVDIDYLLGRRSGEVQRTQSVQLEFANAIRVHLARLVADYGDSQPVPDLRSEEH